MTTEQYDQLITEKQTQVRTAYALLAAAVLIFTVLEVLRPRVESKPPAPPTSVQWIGRLAAGDGAKGAFAVQNIEIGLRSDGTLIWRRRVNP